MKRTATAALSEQPAGHEKKSRTAPALASWIPAEYVGYAPQSQMEPALRVLGEPFARHAESKRLERMFTQQQAPDAFVQAQQAYIERLDDQTRSAIEAVISSNRGKMALREYWRKITDPYWVQQIRIRATSPAEFERLVAHELTRLQQQYKHILPFFGRVQRAILDAPRSPVPLTLYHGQTDMQPFMPETSFPFPAAYELQPGATAVLSTFLSADNNLTLALYGRPFGPAGLYWDVHEQCCLWRISVPRGFPVLFVEDRDHVLLPAGTVVRITGKRTLTVPIKYKPQPLLMYEVQVLELASRGLELANPRQLLRTSVSRRLPI